MCLFIYLFISMASAMEDVRKHFLQAVIAQKIMKRKDCDYMFKQTCRLLNGEEIFILFFLSYVFYYST